MSWWTRIGNTLRSGRLTSKIDEELQSHLAEAVQQGRDPVEARRAFGSVLRHREHSRDVRLAPWVDSVRADAVFGWRQLIKRKTASAAAVLSLGLAIGSCTAAFRLIDALLLRPLPVAHPERLYSLSHASKDPDGRPRTIGAYEYPLVQRMRAAVEGQAELLAFSNTERIDLTYRSDEEMEKANRQYVSGQMFNTFGLRAAAGRVFTGNDDVNPGGHPYAVLSHDYWSRRFGRDAAVVGKPLHIGGRVYTIVGVCDAGFTGVEPGTVVDLFVPIMMHPAVTRSDGSWARVLAELRPGVVMEPVQERMRVPFRAFREERAREMTSSPPQRVAQYLGEVLSLEPAPAGASRLQQDYRQPLLILGSLVALVLLIACANIANLLTAQAAVRAREMALRVSIGAGRWRLMQLVLVESAWLAVLSTVAGALFAWWAAPFVVSRINPANNPVRLSLPADWRVLGFALALALAVTILFGLAPALRASSVKPASALKGGDDPHSRRRLMHGLIATQAAFCFLVLFVAGLFVTTFDRLSHTPTGFSTERLLLLDTVAQRPQTPARWEQAVEQLRQTPGVERVAVADFPLLRGVAWNGSVRIDGGPPSLEVVYFLSVSSGWLETMQVPLRSGRDFRAGERYPGVAIVNETFVKHFFAGENPLGKAFQKAGVAGALEVVGVAGDARYRDVRGAIPPVVYVPFDVLNAKGESELKRNATIIVKTASGNPLALAASLRREVPRAWPEFRVSNVQTQEELNQSHTVRERLLATLGLFFAMIALLLAGVGLYGVLDYSVLQRRREIGIRLAVGATATDIARRVTVEVFSMVVMGAIAGLGLGMAAVRSMQSLFYQVKATDPEVLMLPAIALIAAAVAAALPAVLRAVRIDPATMLRAD